ncbi:MAG: Fe-S-containing protein [Syntrophothermus sp.]
MVEALVITLREGIEAALVIGIILAYLRRTGRTKLNRPVYMGLAAAVAASLLGALLIGMLNLDAENELVEGIMYWVAGLFVATMVVWMWRTGRSMKRQMEDRLGGMIASPARGGFGLALFTFVMVFREGIETVLFLAALSLTGSGVLQFVGGLLGLALAALFAVYFIRGSVNIDLKRFFNVTSVILLLLVVKLLAGGLHEWGEVGIIPLTPAVMRVIGWIVRDSTSTILLMALLAAPVVTILLGAKTPDVQTPDVTSGAAKGDASRDGRRTTPEAVLETPADRRKKLADARRLRLWRYAIAGITALIILALASTLFVGAQSYDPAPVTVTAANGRVRVPAAELADRRLHKFVYDTGTAQVRFLLVKRGEKDIGSALDACEICGDFGYTQGEDVLVCKNCNAPIDIPTVGMSGGCNPIGIKSGLDGSDVIVDVQDLAAHDKVFAKGSK